MLQAPPALKRYFQAPAIGAGAFCFLIRKRNICKTGADGPYAPLFAYTALFSGCVK